MAVFVPDLGTNHKQSYGFVNLHLIQKALFIPKWSLEVGGGDF